MAERLLTPVQPHVGGIAERKIIQNATKSYTLGLLQRYLTAMLVGDGKGHITVEGTARNHFETMTHLTFRFTIADSLSDVDPPTVPMP